MYDTLQKHTTALIIPNKLTTTTAAINFRFLEPANFSEDYCRLGSISVPLGPDVRFF